MASLALWPTHPRSAEYAPLAKASSVKQLDEILKYKWIESERAGFDIGMDRAIREWLQNHFTAWAAAHPPAED